MNMITVNNKKATGRWGQQASCMGRERERKKKGLADGKDIGVSQLIMAVQQLASAASSCMHACICTCMAAWGCMPRRCP